MLCLVSTEPDKSCGGGKYWQQAMNRPEWTDVCIKNYIFDLDFFNARGQHELTINRVINGLEITLRQAMELRKYLPVFIKDQPEHSAILQLGQLNNWSDVPSAVAAPFNSVSMSASCAVLPAQLLSCGKTSSWGLGPCYWSRSREHHFLFFILKWPKPARPNTAKHIFW